MGGRFRDPRLVWAGVGLFMFAVVFAWLSIFVGAGYDGEDPTPMMPRIMFSAAIAAPAWLVAAWIRLRTARDGARGFEVNERRVIE
jgi:apolipoprotein N-acyltransferase